MLINVCTILVLPKFSPGFQSGPWTAEPDWTFGPSPVRSNVSRWWSGPRSSEVWTGSDWTGPRPECREKKVSLASK